MYIEKICIQNFRKIDNLELCLDKFLTLMVGRNNVGKTTIVQFLKLVLNSGSLTLDDYPIFLRQALYEKLEQYWTKGKAIDFNVLDLPMPTMKFTVNYEEEFDEQCLDALIPFIVDLDWETKKTNIEAVYELDPTELEKIRESCQECLCRLSKRNGQNGHKKNDQRYLYVKKIAADIFSRVCKLHIYASNPKNEKDRFERKLGYLKELFPCCIISAERDLDETQKGKQRPLESVLLNLFSLKDNGMLDKGLGRVVKDLNLFLEELKFSSIQRFEKNMDEVFNKLMPKSGYPSVDDLRPCATLNISFKDMIKSADLTYTLTDSKEKLPSTHNGLGYKNLLKMILELAGFAKKINNGWLTIPLILIEEPEAHMHPQLQKNFVKFLEDFTKDLKTQILLSTHSPHIANSAELGQIRYLFDKDRKSRCKSLADFCVVPNYKKFLQKYMEISKCDLYFCDKAVLIEGASERLLLPKMIEKCYRKKLFDTIPEPKLPFQYVSYIEVGGAHAYKFFGLVDFLEIPTLVLTDIDYVCGKKRISCSKEEATDTSNTTIKKWYSEAGGSKKGKRGINELLNGLKNNKTIKNRHIEYQEKESDGTYPRSLEAAIASASNKGSNIFKRSEQESKTDYAIKLLTDKKYENFTVPKYIENGLKWLNDCKR